jgi:hypothetical protein
LGDSPKVPGHPPEDPGFIFGISGHNYIHVPGGLHCSPINQKGYFAFQRKITLYEIIYLTQEEVTLKAADKLNSNYCQP